ncbi:unnamed protein product [Cyprideis torosa]|uniref:Uncharacterized protein n=1 Tax=Cyprideis torosa TaxID=163714 RepID=A0A7R8WFN0_9CRUS|nr:unnamed protein product [Cyprideis torosa]CAG0897208.1 unnamed protein product [Cyprideis torosa]
MKFSIVPVLLALSIVVTVNNLDALAKPSPSVSVEVAKVYKGQCDPPFTAANGGHCYFPSYDQLVTTFKGAQLVCSWLHPNGKLAEFETLQELLDVTSFLNHDTSTYDWASPGPWIGAVEKGNTKEFVWHSSNEPLEVGNWAKSRHDSTTSGDGVALDASENFQWIEVDSQKTLPILCEIPPNPPPVVLKCPYKFFPLGESCYRVVTDLQLTWDEAQSYCKSVANGGKLAELETHEEIVLVTTHLAENKYPCKRQWHDVIHAWKLYAICEAPLIKT